MLLLLAGTGEAREIAKFLSDERIPAMASLAGATRDPNGLAITSRSGGFGGGKAFEDFLDDFGITAILDATHPFAARISRRTADIAARRGLAYLQVLRPPWVPGPDDNWISIEKEQDAAKHIPDGSTVFLATGRKTLADFENLSSCRVICRRIDPPQHPFPFANGEYLLGRPPFSVADELKLFRQLDVGWLVVKNAGGVASATKLTAAKELGIPVVMIKRPPQPNAGKVETVDQAMHWVRSLPW